MMIKLHTISKLISLAICTICLFSISCKRELVNGIRSDEMIALRSNCVVGIQFEATSVTYARPLDEDDRNYLSRFDLIDMRPREETTKYDICISDNGYLTGEVNISNRSILALDNGDMLPDTSLLATRLVFDNGSVYAYDENYNLLNEYDNAPAAMDLVSLITGIQSSGPFVITPAAMTLWNQNSPAGTSITQKDSSLWEVRIAEVTTGNRVIWLVDTNIGTVTAMMLFNSLGNLTYTAFMSYDTSGNPNYPKLQDIYESLYYLSEYDSSTMMVRETFTEMENFILQL